MKKLDLKPTLPLFLSILLGAAGVFMVKNYLSAEKKALNLGLEPVRIVVAKRNIPANEPLTLDMVAARPIPKKFVHANAIYPEEAESTIGRELLYPVREGDPILWMDFKGGERYRGFSSMIKDGERALTLSVDQTSNIAGLLQPGDHIDILGTFRPFSDGGKKSSETTITILQNVVILATGQITSARSSRRGANEASNLLTILVTPEEASLLVHAQQYGKLYNVLRNPEDIETIENMPKITISDILQTEIREQIQTARDNRVLVIRGGQKEHERVE
jgi:pilus assembly protein CpaB